MRIQNWSVDRPLPYARNPRTIPQRAIDKAAASIAEGESLRRICADAAMPAMSSIMRWLFDPHPEGDPRFEFREQYTRAQGAAAPPPSKPLRNAAGASSTPSPRPTPSASGVLSVYVRLPLTSGH